MSSLFSLIVGTVVGLTQYRIKRLFAYSTISHVGYILLALAISSVESTQAFIFYVRRKGNILEALDPCLFIGDRNEYRRLLARERLITNHAGNAGSQSSTLASGI